MEKSNSLEMKRSFNMKKFKNKNIFSKCAIEGA